MSSMEVVVSEEAAELIAARGGRLYVWLTKGRCCGGLTVLRAAHEPQRGRDFRRVFDQDGFELYLPRTLATLPQKLELDVHRFPRRVAAYWNGCAWVA